MVQKKSLDILKSKQFYAPTLYEGRKIKIKVAGQIFEIGGDALNFIIQYVSIRSMLKYIEINWNHF